jgi:hypothetical protein
MHPRRRPGSTSRATGTREESADSGTGQRLVGSTGAFCSVEARDDVKAFFADPQGARRRTRPQARCRKHRRLHRVAQALQQAEPGQVDRRPTEGAMRLLLKMQHKDPVMTRHAEGTFDVKTTPLAADDALGHADWPLLAGEAVSRRPGGKPARARCWAQGDPATGNAGYVAIEQVTGTLERPHRLVCAAAHRDDGGRELQALGRGGARFGHGQLAGHRGR